MQETEIIIFLYFLVNLLIRGSLKITNAGCGRTKVNYVFFILVTKLTLSTIVRGRIFLFVGIFLGIS